MLEFYFSQKRRRYFNLWEKPERRHPCYFLLQLLTLRAWCHHLPGKIAPLLQRLVTQMLLYKPLLLHRRHRDWSVNLQCISLSYVQGVSESLRRYLEQQDIRTVFKSDTTLRSHLVRPKDTVNPAKQDGVVYRIPCECGKVYIGETRRSM